MSKINLTHNKTEYTLEFNRQSVKTMEGWGFVMDEVATKPATMIPLLFTGAFAKNHRGLKRKVIDEIYEEIGNKSALIEALVEMYAETLTTLIEDKEDEGNVQWAVVK